MIQNQAPGQAELLGLGEDDKPGGVAGGFAGQHHVVPGAEGLGFLQQHFPTTKQADGNFPILLISYLDGGVFAELGGLGFGVLDGQFLAGELVVVYPLEHLGQAFADGFTDFFATLFFLAGAQD